MKNKLLFLLVMISMLSFGNCATIITGGTERITVNSTEKKTRIFINGQEAGMDTATLTVKKDRNVSIRVTKKGCNDAFREIETKFNYWACLNCYSPIGWIIDYVTSAIWKIEDTTITLNPVCDQEEEKKSKDDEEEEEEKVEKKKKKKTK